MDVAFLVVLLFWPLNRFQFRLQIAGSTIFFRSFERIHRRSVIFSKLSNEVSRCGRKIERIAVSDERNLLLWNPCGSKSLDHVALDPPCHRADEAFRRWRGISGADLQNLRHQRWVIRNPVSHDDSAARPGHTHHLLGDIERLGREHRTKDADNEVKVTVLQLVQIGGISFLKSAIGKPLFLCALVSGLNKISGNIDAQHFSSKSRGGQRRRAVAASEIQNFETLSDPEALDERLSALPHALRNTGKIALLPKCFVRIHLNNPFLRQALLAKLERRSWIFIALAVLALRSGNSRRRRA